MAQAKDEKASTPSGPPARAKARKSSTKTPPASAAKTVRKSTKAATPRNTAAHKTTARPSTAGKSVDEIGQTQRPAAPTDEHLPKLFQGPQPEPGTKRGRATRERLLNAALSVFERKGFLETNVSDICKEAGAAHGTFYIYFKSKDDVWYALVDRNAALRQMATTAPAEVGGTVYDRFAYTLTQYFEDIVSRPAWARTLEQVATIDDKTRIHRLEIRRAFRNRILHGIERLQEAGLADPGAHPEIVAEAIVSMLHNFAYMNVVLADQPTYDLGDSVETLAMIWARSIGLDIEHLSVRPGEEAG